MDIYYQARTVVPFSPKRTFKLLVSCAWQWLDEELCCYFKIIFARSFGRLVISRSYEVDNFPVLPKFWLKLFVLLLYITQSYHCWTLETKYGAHQMHLTQMILWSVYSGQWSSKSYYPYSIVLPYSLGHFQSASRKRRKGILNCWNIIIFHCYVMVLLWASNGVNNEHFCHLRMI